LLRPWTTVQKFERMSKKYSALNLSNVTKDIYNVKKDLYFK